MAVFFPATANEVSDDNFGAIALYNHAVDEAEAGRYEESANLTRQALEIQPNFTLALITRIGVLLELERMDEAETALNKAMSLDPENPAVLASAASVWMKKGNYRESVMFAEKALERDPILIEAWIMKGTAYGELGDYSEEINASEMALAIDPKNNLALQNLQYARSQLQDVQTKRSPGAGILAIPAFLLAGWIHRKY